MAATQRCRGLPPHHAGPAVPGHPADALAIRQLAGRRWLVWECVTLADYAVAAPLMYKDRARLPLDEYPPLLAWCNGEVFW